MTGAMHWMTGVVAAGLLTGAATAADRAPAIALVNESPSLPKGVYGRLPGGPLGVGSVVAVPQPVSARAYLGSLGMPADVLLLKRVAAVGGERVCVRGRIVETPRRRVIALERDRRGVGLARWRECRVLGADELFLLGDTPGSYDSRYFGPVSREEVTGVYREMLTW